MLQRHEHFTLVIASQVAVGATLVMSVFISTNLFSVTFPSADWPAGHAAGDLHCCVTQVPAVPSFSLARFDSEARL